ncbi:MAG: prepilin-type N-terminal cleavage/methylation domain-containing protein [Deltaproteobacteria bacterium]|jgi:prepilin-type N-terminal cleavage/methylation domain-containing protein|nr:prepilin-type N-terminal cleavage/methylation domain-containing protein [Deltaproteobacteria bacterium]
MSIPPEKARSAFTLFELLVVIAIVGILSLIAYPLLSRILPDSRVSSEVKQTDSYMQKARLKAATVQKPVRVVISCAEDPCWIESQTAVYTGSAVTGWQADTGSRRRFAKGVSVADIAASPAHDGASKAPAGVRYAIFMPDSRVYSDPRPFDLFFYPSAVTSAEKRGWRLTVGPDSGRVNTARADLTLP